MAEINVNRRSLGVNFDMNNNAEVLVWAPLADTVEITLNNKAAKAPLKKSDMDIGKLIQTK